MRRARVLILDTGREWGGGTNSLLEFLRRMDREQFEMLAAFSHDYPKGRVSTIRRELEHLGVEFLHLGEPVVSPLEKAKKEIGRTLLSFSSRLRRRFLSSWDLRVRKQPASEKIEKILREREIDLLYTNNQPSANLEGFLATEREGIPVVAHLRSVASLAPHEVELANRAVERFICVSHAVVDHYRRQGISPEKMSVVHNGIALDEGEGGVGRQEEAREYRKKWGVAGGGIAVGIIGSLLRRKGHRYFLEAARVVKQRSPLPVVFVIVGEGPERGRIEALCRSSGLSGDVHLTGFLEDPLPLIRALDVVVMASDEEGFPRVLLEAMLVGKPVAAFSLASVAELVEDGRTGFLAPLHDSTDLAEKILRLVTDKDLREQMGARGRERVRENFSVDRYVRGVEDVLRDVVKRRRRTLPRDGGCSGKVPVAGRTSGAQ